MLVRLEELEIAVAPVDGKLRMVTVNGQFADELPVRIVNATNFWLEGRLTSPSAARFIRNVFAEIRRSKN